MKTHMNTIIRQFVVAVFALGAVLLFASASSAWTAPTGNPPSSNVAAPVNVGSVQQVKSGGLGVTSLVADRLCLGTNCITSWPSSSSAGLPSCPQGAVLESVSEGQWACTYTRDTNGTGSNPGSGNPILCHGGDAVVRYRDIGTGRNDGAYLVNASGQQVQQLAQARGCRAWEGSNNAGAPGCEVSCRKAF